MDTLLAMLLPWLQPRDELALRSCMCCGALSRALAMRGHAGWQACPTWFYFGCSIVLPYLLACAYCFGQGVGPS